MEEEADQVVKKADETIQQNPRLGAFYQIIVVATQSVNWLTVKFLYIRRPDINGFQILFFRSVMVTIFAYIYTMFCKKNLREAIMDPIKNEQKTNLFLRCMQGFTIKSIQFFIFKYFKLTTISLIINLGPIITLLFSYTCLGESVTCSDIAQVIIAFSGTAIIT